MSLAQAFGLGGDRYSRELDEIEIPNGISKGAERSSLQIYV